MDETRPAKRVAYYIRVSTDDQVDRYGPAMQKEALDNLVRSKGLEPPPKELIFWEEGISGTKPLEERPEFARLMDTVLYAQGRKPFDIVAVYKIDRFARKLKILLQVLDFFKTNSIDFISANESIDTSTPFGVAIIGIMGVIAELEVETIKERTHSGIEQAIKEGIYTGRIAPFGLIKDGQKRLEIFEPEAEIMRDIFFKYVFEHLSLQAIADELSARNIPTPAASAELYHKFQGHINKVNNADFWTPNSVRRLITDEIYIGNYYTNKTSRSKLLPKAKWKLSPYRHPNIIEESIFYQAQRRYKEEKEKYLNNTTATKKHTYLLSGLIKCGACFDEKRDANPFTYTGVRAIYDKEKDLASYYYKCKRKITKASSFGCKSVPIKAELIEDYVVQFITRLLQSPEDVIKHQQSLSSQKSQVASLQNKKKLVVGLLNSFGERRKSILFQHSHGYINDEQLEYQMKSLEEQNKRDRKELENIEIQLSKLTLSTNYTLAFEKVRERYLKNLNLLIEDREACSRIIRSLVDSIGVVSRPIKRSEKAKGRKTPGQLLPESIVIKLKLPTHILADYVSFTKQRYDALEANKTSDAPKSIAMAFNQWSARRDSNS